MLSLDVAVKVSWTMHASSDSSTILCACMPHEFSLSSSLSFVEELCVCKSSVVLVVVKSFVFLAS